MIRKVLVARVILWIISILIYLNRLSMYLEMPLQLTPLMFSSKDTSAAVTAGPAVSQISKPATVKRAQYSQGQV